MRQRRVLSVTHVWTTAITAFVTELKIAGQPLSTQRLRSYQLRCLAHDHQDRGPWELTRADLVTWLSAQAWGPSTQSSYTAALRKFYRFGQDEGHVTSSPAARLPNVRVPKGLPRPAPDYVVDTGIQSADMLVAMAVWVMALTGARRAECAELNKDWVIHDHRGWTLRVVGKGGKVRDIPIAEGMARIILSSPTHYYFPGRVNGHVSADWLGKRVARVLPGRYTCHTLRHRFGTLTYEETLDIRVVQELLGHSSVVTTQVYTEVGDSAKRRAIVGARRGLRISGAHMGHSPRSGPRSEARSCACGNSDIPDNR